METEARPRGRSRLKWVVGATLIVVGIGALAAWAIASPGAVSYYATPSEVKVQGAQAMNRQLRVGGRVADDSLRRSGASVRFVVADGHNSLPVVYRGDIPDTLKPGTDVVAEGRLTSDGTLVASRVLAKCSSKYKSVDDKQPY